MKLLICILLTQAGLAFLGFVVSIVPPKRILFRAVSVIIFVVFGGISIWLTVEKEGEQDRKDKDASANIVELKTQVAVLLNSLRSTPTKEDVSKLVFGMKQGFGRVISSLNSKPGPHTIDTSMVIRGGRVIQQKVKSDDPDFPHALQLTIQNGITVEPPFEMEVILNGEVGDYDFFVAGEGKLEGKQKGLRGEGMKNIIDFGFMSPTITPGSVVVLTIHSKNEISVIRIYRTVG